MEPYVSGRRTACDRCRRQKLRCPPRARHAEPCARCARLGTSCITSRDSLPAGPVPVTAPPNLRQLRPRRSTASDDWRSSPTSTSGWHPGFPGALPFLMGHYPNTVPMPTTTTATATELDSFDGQREGQTETAQSRDDIGAGRGETDLSWGEFAQGYTDATPVHGVMDQWSQEMVAFQAADASPATAGTTPELHQQTASDPGPQHAYSGRQQRRSQAHSACSNGARARQRCDCHLAALGLELSRRLHLRCQDPATSDPSQVHRHSDLEDRAGLQPWSPEPFGDALRLTDEFLGIVRGYAADGNRGGGRPGSENEGSEISLGAVTVLNLLAAYFQILCVYERLVRSICEQLFESGGSASSSESAPAAQGRPPLPGQILPGLQIAGFPIQGRELQARLLVDVIVDQLAALEGLLGLPPLLQVTAGRMRDVERDLGLLENDDRGERLIAALVDSGGGGTVEVGIGDGGADMRAITSLREMFRKIYR